MNELFIDDANYEQFVTDPVVGGEQQNRGMKPRDFQAVPHGSLPFAAAYRLPIIPRGEWSGRIKELEKAQARLSDIVRAANMPSLNQNGTKYCWANAPVNCVRIIRAVNNQPFVELSPASVAARFTNYQNVGGFGTDALKFIVDNGVCSTALWPANAIDQQFDTQASRANAAQHKVTEWLDLKPRSFDQLATFLLLGFPVAVGYNWWEHEVTALDLVETSPGVFGVRIWNSWGDSWSDRGMAVLSESRGTPDDAVAPQVAGASPD